MRESWDTRISFVLAAIGSAVGLGNVWRFPYICYKYGGGAFIIPYIVALFTAGIPLMILEFSFGHKNRLAAPNAFAKLSRSSEWLGWFALLVAFGIVSYYSVIMGWSLNYLKYSLTLEWGNDTQDFFLNKFLSISKSPLELGKIRLPILITLIISWLAMIGCIWRGPKTVGKVIWFTVLAPWIIMVAFFFRGITLPGAMEGIKYYLTPDFSALKNLEVWRNAFGQVFFSLSIGFGVMIAYASYLPERREIVNNAFIVSLADSGTAFFAGFCVFSVLGYYSTLTGTPVPDLVKSSISLAFISYPTIINLMPFGREVWGVLFFLMLLTLGIDSAFSLVEAVIAGLSDKWKIKNRGIINILFVIIGILCGLPYVTMGGLYWIDIIDHYTNTGLIIVAFAECLLIGYNLELSKLKEHCNLYSEIKVGIWWTILIKIVTPLILFFLLVFFVKDEIRYRYGNYPDGTLGIGILVLAIFFLLSFIIMKSKGR